MSVVAFALLAVPATGAEETRPTYSGTTEVTAPVADAYFKAYIARDWDALEPLLADAASFEDQTARLVFGGVAREGRLAMMDLFRNGYASIKDMSFNPLRTIHSADFGLYEGVLHWEIDVNGVIVISETPFVTIVKVLEGKVIEHRDFVDYAPFIAAWKQASEAAKAAPKG
ncbi:nuclear transport factor 2 family protein [Gimibacter soli]|uniref:Nuclear transport factor 2 family protein n=1 Tax=Gimibacter soli TaxID=3024400 RepID=A0AAE9XQ70_9PROT|nr:nuclear transport factor 2 family protein [Gimibacter soli]WCL55253.1 nuclear transport factor 2 family protein [Gimibacter soli]